MINQNVEGQKDIGKKSQREQEEDHQLSFFTEDKLGPRSDYKI